MSGHSKWSKIKRGKAITDAKRGQIFSKLAKIIAVAAREKGADPKTNPSLRIATEKAKAANMPGENIERAIKKGSGELEGARMEKFLYEAYAPGGIALLIEGITDNKNRTLSEVKHILSTDGGKLAGTGSVRYLFDKKGVITIDQEEYAGNKENLEIEAIGADAEDFKWQGNILEIYVPMDKLEPAKEYLIAKNIKASSTSIDWLPSNEIKIEDDKIKNRIDKLMDSLDAHEDVNEIYSNCLEQ